MAKADKAITESERGIVARYVESLKPTSEAVRLQYRKLIAENAHYLQLIRQWGLFSGARDKLTRALLEDPRYDALKWLRPATAEEYADWLEAHLKAGGAITHDYDFPLGDRVLIEIAESVGAVLPAGTGAAALNVIAPKGGLIDFEIRKANEGQVFRMGEPAAGLSFVPCYSDVKKILGQRGIKVDAIRPVNAAMASVQAVAARA